MHFIFTSLFIKPENDSGCHDQLGPLGKKFLVWLVFPLKQFFFFSPETALPCQVIQNCQTNVCKTEPKQNGSSEGEK